MGHRKTDKPKHVPSQDGSGTITRITEKRLRGRLYIFIYMDDEYWAHCSQSTLEKYNLKIGQTHELAPLLKKVVEGEAISYAIDYLSKYPLTSSRRLTAKLLAREYPSAVIEIVLERARTYKYIDDDQLAVDLIRSGMRHGYSRNQIQLKLRTRELEAELDHWHRSGFDEHISLVRALSQAQWTKHGLDEEQRGLIRKIGELSLRDYYDEEDDPDETRELAAELWSEIRPADEDLGEAVNALRQKTAKRLIAKGHSRDGVRELLGPETQISGRGSIRPISSHEKDKHLKQLRKRYPNKQDERKATSWLLRRGYDFEQAREAWQQSRLEL